MQTGLQLKELATTLAELRPKKLDFVAPRDGLQAVLVDNRLNILAKATGQRFGIRQSAHDQIASVYAFYLGASAGQVIGVLGSFGITPPLISELISVAMTVATKAANRDSPDVAMFEMKPVS